MKSPITLPTLALAAFLSLGSTVASSGVAQAATAQDTPVDNNATDSSKPVADTWITAKVKSELAATKGISSTDVSVTTVNGVVTLTGVLDDDIAVRKAVAAAQSVKGVKRVDSSGLKAKG